MMQPIHGDKGGTVLGPSNPMRDAQNPDVLLPPSTDYGTLPNLRWSFSDSHMRLEKGGWSRETTVRELPSSPQIAAVNMRLVAGGVRELHWHREAEWSYMLKGHARITAVDQEGHHFQADVSEGDIWYFPSGTARMTVFASAGLARTFNYQAGDVGSVPFPMGHYIENTGNTTLRFLEVFKSNYFADISLANWMNSTPHDLVRAHLNIDESLLAKIPKTKTPIVPF